MISPVSSTRPDWTTEDAGENPAEKLRLPRWKWWQLPHLLSLDAPLVAVTWLWWWASEQNIHLPTNRFVILALAVWGVYVADRLADVAGNKGPGQQTDRHRFSAAFAYWQFRALGVIAAVLAVLTLLDLPPRRFLGGLGLLGLVALYYRAIHHAPRPIRPWMPKEAVVGGVFALGTVFFLLGEGVPAKSSLWLEMGLFGGLCFLNCALISLWEQSPRDLEDPASLLRAFPRLTTSLASATLVLAVVSAACAVAIQATGPLPLAMSAGALWVLHRRRASFSPETLRVLADLVLLTPLLLAVIGRGERGSLLP